MHALTIADYRDCSTANLRGLDLQLIDQINRLVPGLLVTFSHLPIVCGPGVHPYLQRCAVQALEKAIAARPGQALICNSAYRSLAQQMILWSHSKTRRCGITAAAAPGLSNHNSGLALDVEDHHTWKSPLERFGWDWLGSWDRWHFDFVGPGRRDLKPISIEAFQCLWNLNGNSSARIPEDGCWGPLTEQALLKTPVGGFSRTPSKIIDPLHVAVLPQPKIQPLRQGMKGGSVRSLQMALQKRGYRIVADGDFGPLTVAALKSFQVSQGLPVDGVAGVQSLSALQ